MSLDEWANCHTRGPFLRNSLRNRILELRNNAKKVRCAYHKKFMGEPCEYLAVAYDEAADVLQKHLDLLTHKEAA